jgi:hypothetical protein
MQRLPFEMAFPAGRASCAVIAAAVRVAGHRTAATTRRDADGRHLKVSVLAEERRPLVQR